LNFDQFDREYCHAVKSACLRAVANTSYAVSGEEDRTLPADEINAALIDIMGIVAAMVEESLPKDMRTWAEGVADKFAASFHAARASLTANDLELLGSRR
jgi:hypothetical protein